MDTPPLETELPRIAKRPRPSGFLIAVCLILSGFLAYQFATWASQSPRRPPEVLPNNKVGPTTLLVPSTPRIDLGTLKPGGRRQESIRLSNPGKQAVEITQIDTSCDCLEIHLRSRTIGPSEVTEGQVTVDFSSDPAFKGKLRIEVNGRTQTGELAFALVVYVGVFRDSS